MDFKVKFLGMICACTVAAGITAGAARAATTGSGKVSTYTVLGTSYVFFNVDSVPSGTRPTCHNGWYMTAYAFDVSTNKGKALLSAVQAAMLAGKRLAITGGSTCTNTGGSVGNIETAQVISTFDQ